MGAPSQSAAVTMKMAGIGTDRLAPPPYTCPRTVEQFCLVLPAARSKEKFAGYRFSEKPKRMFAMKLMGQDLKNFTGDGSTKGPVFCFDNRLILPWHRHQNSNSDYPTENNAFPASSSDREKDLPGLPEKPAIKGCNRNYLPQIHNRSLWKTGCGNLYFVKDGTGKG